MIRLTRRGKIIYQMLGLIVILLVLYTILFLLSALQTLPYFTLAHLIPVQTILMLTDQTLHLLILTGVITGGIIMCITQNLNEHLLRGLFRAWVVLIIATFLSSVLEIKPLLNGITVILLIAYLVLNFKHQQPTPILHVWRIGIILIIVSLSGQWIMNADWQVVIRLFQIHVAYSVTGVSIIFWLMTKWSNVRIEWAQDGAKIIAGLVALGGILISFAPLGYASLVGMMSGFVVPICFMILGGHSYRALRDRNQNMSLSPHWIAIAVLFWMAGGGFLGTISTQSGIQNWMGDTRLADAQFWLMNWGMIAIILSLVNYTASDLRGENRRVTGYMPLWLIGFGNAFVAVILGCIGVVEIYLTRFLSVDYKIIAYLLTPLLILQLILLLTIAIGVLIYALGFWVRRPQIVVD